VHVKPMYLANDDARMCWTICAEYQVMHVCMCIVTSNMHVGPPTQTRKGLFSSSLNSDIIRALFRVPGLQVKRYASDKVSAHERNGDNQAQEPG